MCIGLLDLYHELAKTQHGCSKVNQLPWEAYDRVESLKTRLDEMSSSNYDDMACWKSLCKYKSDLEQGIIDEVPIVTETKRSLRNSGGSKTIDSILKATFDTLVAICKRMKEELCSQVSEPELISHIRNAFSHWEEESLIALLKIANSQGNEQRHYGDEEPLLEQYKELKKIFMETNWSEKAPAAHKWQMICTRPYNFTGLQEIIHFALCCFVKAPIETIVEAVPRKCHK